MNYKGLDDEKVTPLCPVVVVPSHEVQEIPTEQGLSVLPTHQSGRKNYCKRRMFCIKVCVATRSYLIR